MEISLRKKIVSVFIFLVLVGGAVGYLSYYQHYVLNQKLRVLEIKENLFNSVLEARRYEKNFLLSSKVEHLQEALSYVRQCQKIMQKIMAEYSQFTLTGDLQGRLDQLNAYEEALATLLEYGTGSPANATKMTGDFAHDIEKIKELGRSITVDMESMIANERTHIKKLVAKSQVLLFVGWAVIFIISCLAALFLVFHVHRPLKTIEDAIQKIAGGDYSNIPEISTGDEFESLVVSLNRMIHELHRRSEQLLQSKKLASLGTLTSGVAHELNNPLNNISTSVQILLEELEETDLEYKKTLLIETEKQIMRARETVRALLEFSREKSFSVEVVRFRPLVEDTIKLIKSELPANVALKVEVPHGIVGRMDPRRIQQVLLNLMLNGVQAMDSEGLLRVSASVREQEGIFCFQVQDTGQGIPEENIPKIFDPFFTTKQEQMNWASNGAVYQGIVEQQGSGLGLSICHGIVEKHGGHIEVESESGQGTTFRVCLPLEKRDGKAV